MSKRGTKRKADIEPADSSEDLVVKESKAKRMKTKSKSKRLSRLEEYAEDEGRESSRNFQRWAEIFETNTKGEVAKSKTFMKNFGIKVKKQTDRMKTYMHEQETKLTEAKDQGTVVFKKLYSDAALLPGVSNEPKGKTGNVGKEGHVLFKEAEDVISGGFSLLKQFREADKQLENHKLKLPTAQWKKDRKDIKELLAFGREYGEKLVENELAPNIYPPPQPDKYSANGNEKKAAELFKNRKASHKSTWGIVAADQVKKLTALVKTIPPKEPERVYGI
ncbi:hypothetical protein GGR53DRAFT_529273 [Hypoxylon sp. FL1150]|nr:hypothetical protein GGR53DRAFT_529273 [Hypoxylon sp. FL1150]